MRVRLAAALLALLLAGCSCTAPRGMIVQLRSNFVPGIEFDEARTELWVPGSRTPALTTSASMHWQDPVERGMQIADAPDVEPGTYTVIVTLRRAGSAVAQRTVLVTFEGARAVTVLVTRDCFNVTCETGLTCLAGVCVPQDCLDGSSFDGCPSVTCVEDDDCEELPIDCTDVMCLEGHCHPFPAHDECGDEEWCNPDEGCRVLPDLEDGGVDAGPDFDGGDLDAGTLDAGGPGCTDTGCNDGNPCTDDACEASGCVYRDNTEPCDDGTFCNGTDRCGGGRCVAGTADPCPGMSNCDEIEDTCTGCASDADCPADTAGAWSSCDFATTCGTAGTRQRTLTSYQCVAGSCEASTSPETGSCTRPSRDGTSCGARTCPSFGACGGFSDACDTSGTQSRTCTERVCGGGTCNDQPSGESTSCSRATDGDVCGGGAGCDGWGPCDYADECDEDGLEERTCHDWRCNGGSCRDSPSTESRACSRDREGDACGSNGTYCGNFAACHVCRSGACTVNTPHFDADCNPSCGAAANLCGTFGTCCGSLGSCTSVGRGPPYADCAQCCEAASCF